jgi:hypothetical protein
VNLRAGAREVQLADGTIDMAMVQGATGGPQIDTPSLTLRPNQSGEYRLTVMSNGETVVTVRSGSATVVTPNGPRALAPGSTLTI